MDMAVVKKNIRWDFSIDNEFSAPNRRTGYTFVIDQFAASPQLALYRIGPYSSHTDFLEKQPPQELLIKALSEQCIAPTEDGLFKINQELRHWIEDHLLKY